MKGHVKSIALALAFLSATALSGRAQGGASADAAAVVPAQAPRTLTPLKVQVIISRFQGDRKVSSLPYTLAVNADDGVRGKGWGQYMPNAKVSLRMGMQVPIPTVAAGTTTTVYKDVGTNIDCFAYTNDDGRFNVSVSVEDSSVYPEGQTQNGTRVGETPVFRSFRSSASLLLKDGQTGQFTAATDKVSGETVKIDVSVNVVK